MTLKTGRRTFQFETKLFSDPFPISTTDGEQRAVDVVSDDPRYKEHSDNPETAEYFVRIEWLDTVALKDAFNELGLLATRTRFARLRHPSGGIRRNV